MTDTEQNDENAGGGVAPENPPPENGGDTAVPSEPPSEPKSKDTAPSDGARVPLRAADFPNTPFDASFDAQALKDEIKQLRQKTLAEIAAYFAYYDNSARRKKKIARCYRIVAVAATAIAGILLVLSHQDIAGMFSIAAPADAKAAGENAWDLARFFPNFGGWAILLGLIAGAAIATDRMSGTSKGWMRYVLARQELEAIRHRYEIELLAAEIEGKALFMIAVCQAAMEEVDEIVFQETKQWVRDYREDLEQLQQAVSKFRPSEKKTKP